FHFGVIDLLFDTPSPTLANSAEIGPNPACLLLNIRKTVLILVGGFSIRVRQRYGNSQSLHLWC
ncbi:MAG: hypothetical protein ACRD5J_12910, partial [Nitrososphaeraceae archaeon]